MSKKSNEKFNKNSIHILILTSVIVLVGVLIYQVVLINYKNKLYSQISLELNKSEGVQSNNAYASIPKDEIKYIGSQVDIQWNPSSYSTVALVRIESIDGGRTYNPIFETSGFPQTFGKMTVLDVYRGDIKSGDRLTYSRLGGIVTYDEYWRSLNKEQQDKILYLNKGKKPIEKKYVQEKTMEDIEVEVDKEYVVFLIPQSSKDNKYQEYFIDGYQFGLREAKKVNNITTALNNNTKKWENIDTIVK